MDNQDYDLEDLAYEGIYVDFKFNSNQPTFGDLCLITGDEHPDFPANNTLFSGLVNLGFNQVDDYFGIENDSDIGDDVKLWLFPLINNNEVTHHPGPFATIRVNYPILRNTAETAELFETVFKTITAQLDVTPIYNKQPLSDYAPIKATIEKVIQYCRQELEVEPGSDDALELDY